MDRLGTRVERADPAGVAAATDPPIVVLVPGPIGSAGWLAQHLNASAAAPGPPWEIRNPAELTGWESAGTRWVWDDTESLLPVLLAAGFHPLRCHDIRLTERILLTREGRFGEPAWAGAVAARLAGSPTPPDPGNAHRGDPALFDPALVGQAGLDQGRLDRATTPDPFGAVTSVRTAFADQLRRIGADRALRLLVAAESASGLAAAEMGFLGLPLRVDLADRILTDALGPRPSPGTRPAKLAVLADEISAAFGAAVNPDSPADLLAAFHRAGIDLQTTRSAAVGRVDHPAVPSLLRYKELSRLFTANGWHWLGEWVRDNRFHAGYLPGAVVSGRWAARGGGALQIPKMLRRAVIAEPGYVLVVADAAQLEPRVLAALSGDPRLQAAAAQSDLYDALAADGFGGDRARAKVAMLGAMYGATGGEAGRLLGTLQRRYPVAMAYVERAAQQGERGALVSSVLGRTCPPPSVQWQDTVLAGALPDATAAAQARARSAAAGRARFTRNFVVQASAADWAAVWLSSVRRELRAVAGAELVFFQHDELLIHTPAKTAALVGEMVVGAAESARTLVFPGTATATPVRPVTVACYADAK